MKTFRIGSTSSSDTAERASPAAGKRTLTEGLAPSSAVLDQLSSHGAPGEGVHIDETTPPATPAATPAPAPAATPAPTGTPSPAASGPAPAPAPSPPAVPTNLVQTLTSWTPGASRYGFQLSFSCSSSSGAVADLQSQPNLRWREYVTYSRNDFAHRISPPSPTILPGGGGVAFTSPSATAASANSLVFNNVTDTHWMPTSAVRAADFTPTATPPRTLPAIMISSQVYQYSTDNTTWTTFAGPFTLTRTFDGASGAQTFSTNKSGVHSVSEPYKP